MASIPGFRFDITGASGTQNLLSPKQSWRAYVLPRGGYASQDSTGTLITFDSAAVASRFAVNNWLQAGLSPDNIRQVSAVGGNSISVSGANLTVSTNNRIYLIGNTQPTVSGGSATYTVPDTIIRQRDDDGSTIFTNSQITSNSDGLIQGFAETNLYDAIIQDGNQANQGSVIDMPVGVVEGVSVSTDALFGASVTINGALGVTGTAVFGSTVTVNAFITGTTITATTVRTSVEPVINVKHPDYGAVGDDSTDDTTAIQNAINDLRTTAAELYFPPGTYKITTKLSLGTMSSRIIGGAGRGVSIIKQYTANTPILESDTTDTHTISLRDLTLQYNALQGAGNTSAVALSFAGSTGTNHYWWSVNNVHIENTNTGIGLSEGTGQIAVWSSSFRDIRIFATSLRGIDFKSPTAIGMNGNVFSRVMIDNLNSVAVATGEAIRLDAQKGCVLEGINVENWKNRVFTFQGGTFVTCNGIRFETVTIDSNFADLVGSADEGVTIINGMVCTTITVNVAGRGAVFSVDNNNNRLYVKGLQVSATLTSGTMNLIEGNSGTGPASISIEDPILTNVTRPGAATTGDLYNDALFEEGKRTSEHIITFTDQDATPDVDGGNVFITANTMATTITAMTNGIKGQTIKVIIADTNTTIDFTSTTLKGNVGVDWTPTTLDHMTCVYDGTNWFCDISDNTA